jgi:hypothetical protein
LSETVFGRLFKSSSEVPTLIETPQSATDTHPAPMPAASNDTTKTETSYSSSNVGGSLTTSDNTAAMGLLRGFKSVPIALPETSPTAKPVVPVVSVKDSKTKTLAPTTTAAVPRLVNNVPSRQHNIDSSQRGSGIGSFFGKARPRRQYFYPKAFVTSKAKRF